MLDLARRGPVWLAMARLFWDGDIGEEGITQIARVLRDSGYGEAELREIYREEVAPVCYAHIMHPGGGGEDFGGAMALQGGLADPQWLSQAIVGRLRRERASGAWWSFSGFSQRTGAALARTEWEAVMRVYQGLRRDPHQLIDTLRTSSDVAMLVDALEDLALLGAQATPALAWVAELLEHRDFRVRAAAVKCAAGVLGPRSVGAVVAHLADPSPTVKAAAICALHRVLDRLADPQPSGADGSLVATPADRLLEKISEQALDAICGHLKDGKSADRLHAARVIERLGPAAGRARRALVDSFGDRNEAVRRAVADALVALNPPVEETLITLKEAIFDESPRVRQTSALCLGRLLARGERRYHSAMSALERALNDPSPRVCEGAAAALGWMGNAAAGAIPRLARLARADDPSTRSTALFALGQMDEAALRELPTMAAALGDANPEVRRAALRAFARLGPMVRPMAPQFEACLKDPDWLTQFEARRTLEAVRADAAPAPGPRPRGLPVWQQPRLT